MVDGGDTALLLNRQRDRSEKKKWWMYCESAEPLASSVLPWSCSGDWSDMAVVMHSQSPRWLLDRDEAPATNVTHDNTDRFPDSLCLTICVLSGFLSKSSSPRHRSGARRQTAWSPLWDWALNDARCTSP